MWLFNSKSWWITKVFVIQASRLLTQELLLVGTEPGGSTASSFSLAKGTISKLSNCSTVEALWSPWCDTSPVALLGIFSSGQYQAVSAVDLQGQEVGRLVLPNGMSSLNLHSHHTRKELCLSPRRGVLQFYTENAGVLASGGGELCSRRVAPQSEVRTEEVSGCGKARE